MITGLHGCRCHPFQSWEDLDMYMKQRLTGGQLVQIRHTGEKGYVVGNEGQYYRINRIPCNVPRDITIEHVSNLIPVSPHYCIYDAPVFGIFKITNDKYNISEGWGFDLVKHKIIGEDEHIYITRLIQNDDGSMLPVGIHRTRLDHWTSGQLSLF